MERMKALLDTMKLVEQSLKRNGITATTAQKQEALDIVQYLIDEIEKEKTKARLQKLKKVESWV